MKSIADRLTPEIAAQLRRDRRKYQVAHFAFRGQFLGRYRDKRVGLVDGALIDSVFSPVEVFHVAEASGRHPFFICVGKAEEPWCVRLATVANDAGSHGD